MTRIDTLCAGIVADPAADAPRLVYADWLEENCPDRIPSPAIGPVHPVRHPDPWRQRRLSLGPGIAVNRD
jgi:uncharacterized protein (TIGR02996 family)